ncbi:MAG: RNA ligase [Hyperionvirus sp.]|uniref:RNA ligase n=1 Tax=Hyperionvirus sp. TaxID=2487770 RepID=A0A3G5A614_9VIRU|nr:MAG: RNA ligase [Hyperionvirus sp.]
MTDYTANSVEPDRCMAQVVTIDKIAPIENATNIELAFILGWQCVVKKDEFKVNDLAIYFSIDSVLDPDVEVMKFLLGKRLKTKKILGALSQGLLAPLVWLKLFVSELAVKLGDDVTKMMRVRKYVMTTELLQYIESGKKSSLFPSFVPKTDEERVQNIPKILELLPGKSVVITRKEDGTSATFIHYQQDETTIFLVCGRNFVIDKNDPANQKSQYHNVENKFQIEKNMRALGSQIAIQGEIVGPKVQTNKIGLSSIDFRVFNIWDIPGQRYLLWEEVTKITALLQLNTVPLIYSGEFKSEWTSVDKLLDIANECEYRPGCPAEGIVVKTNDDSLRYSFKVISNKFLMKYG